MTTDIKRDWFRLACLFLAPQIPQSPTANEIDEREEREIAKWERENPQILNLQPTNLEK
jgi:hypothetical protein